MSRSLPGAYPARHRLFFLPFHRRVTPSVAESGSPTAPAPGLREVFAIWLLYSAVSLIILAVYANHPANVFYHYSGHGLRGAFGRMIVYLNFPFGFVALALLGIAMARFAAFRATVSPAVRRGVEAAAILAVPLLLTAIWPGVVSQASLAVKPINAVPAIGVALAIIVTLAVWPMTGLGEALPLRRADAVRLGIIVALVILGLPWILAELGVRIANVPLLDRWFRPEGTVGGHHPVGVHLGDHHGLDGVLFVATTLILSRGLTRIGVRWLRRTLSIYLGLMLVYGAANALQDFWGEQIVAPGWTRHEMPGVLQPAITPAWGVMVTLGIVAAVLLVLHVERQVAQRVMA